MANRDSVAQSQQSTSRACSPKLAAIGLGWLIGFALFFFSFGLPNHQPATRWLVWQFVPTTLLDVVWPLPEPDSPPSGLVYVGQRVPAIAVAGCTVLAAIGFGLLALKAIGVAAQMGTVERLYCSAGIGLAIWSLVVLGLGLVGLLWQPLIWVLVAIGAGIALWQLWRVDLRPLVSRPASSGRRPAKPSDRDTEPHAPRWLKFAVLAVCIPLVWGTLLGALTPQTDFDSQAYHLNGPKEWFERGRVEFLSFNVYTSFPLLTEMQLLSGMVLLKDCHYGALAGQATLMVFSLLSALAIFDCARRWFSPSAGWLGVLVFLTTPWTYRISIIPYAEGGLSFYLLAAYVSMHRALSLGMTKQTADGAQDQVAIRRGFAGESISRMGWFLLCGAFAGSAMACKYPGLISVVIPIGLGIFAGSCIQRVPIKSGVGRLLAYGFGFLIFMGPWLVKNLMETGNPVYPLAYSLFGGTDWDAATNVRWVRAHSAAPVGSVSVWVMSAIAKFTDVIANNDWHSPLLYGLAPLSLCWSARRKEVVWTWVFLAWLFSTWFLLTHHIDRFWIPMIPVVALLAGGGAAIFERPVAASIAGAAIAASVAFNLTICATPVGGYNAGTTELTRAEQRAASTHTPEFGWINDRYMHKMIAEPFKVLCVGEAATFHARFPVLYNSVFDDCLLETICTDRQTHEMLPAAEIRDQLQSLGVTHVFVNWREILRYREPGSYGYTSFAHPRTFRQLQDLGILGAPLELPSPLGLSELDPKRAAELDEWAPELIVKGLEKPAYLGVQIFPVREGAAPEGQR